MNQFSAKEFYAIAAFFESIEGVVASKQEEVPKEGRARIQLTLSSVAKSCANIALKQSSLAANRLHRELDHPMTSDALRTNLRSVTQLINSGIDTQLFLWVPWQRAEWYSKDAEAIVGAQCCARFPSIEREIKESAKCYALGRYTAAGFHLTRAAEAGVQALARAIKFVPPHNQWTLVFKRVEAELKLPPANRPRHWKKHGKFLTSIAADLSLLAKVWRNDIMHLVVTYGEDEAKELFEVIPKFLRDLAKHMDEKGKLY